MKKIYFCLVVIITLFLLLQSSVYYMGTKSSKYNVINIDNNSGIIKIISSYIAIPIVESRIDFYLKNTGLITHLQDRKYDNRIIYIQDIKKGKGHKILCGQEVIVDLIETSEGDITKNINDKKIIIGSDEQQIFNIALIGMKEEGERTFIVPNDISNRLIGKKNTTTMYNVKLKEVKTHHPDSVKNLLIFDEIIGNEKAIMCGENISLNYTLRDKRGNEIREGNLKFKVGEGKVPIAFDLGVIEMVPGSKRSIISPPDLLLGKEEISILDLRIE